MFHTQYYSFVIMEDDGLTVAEILFGQGGNTYKKKHYDVQANI